MTSPTMDGAGPEAASFYRQVLETLTEAGVPFLVGGTFALARYTGIGRETKDLDVFIQRADWPEVHEALQDAQIDTALTFPHWLGKAYGGRDGELFVDLIFSGGNGVAEVDEIWFANAQEGYVLGVPVRFCPPEEMIWSKSFVMERERFDGADVIHLIHALRDHLDWPHLINRFGQHWRVLLAHLILFGYVYPGEQVPRLVLEDLVQGLDLERPLAEPRLCRGTLLSREQYLVDIASWNYIDAREAPVGKMTSTEIAEWTDAIEQNR